MPHDWNHDRQDRSADPQFLSRADIERILRDAPLDPGFVSDVHAVLDETVDELEAG